MSEKHHHKPEHHESKPNELEQLENELERAVASAESHVEHRVEHENLPENEKRADVEQIKQTVERHSHSVEQTKNLFEQTKETESSSGYVNNELRLAAYHRTMAQVGRRLSAGNRALSKIVHQPVIDALSEVSSKTIARPSGLFGGGFLAAFGTTVYYFISKHYGYEYNFSIFLILVVIGFGVGVVIELVYRIFRLFKS